MMQQQKPCRWLAVPLEWAGATVNDVRALVEAVHQRMGVQFPKDDLFLHALATGRLVGRLPKDLDHLCGRHGRVVFLGSYEIHQSYVDALDYIIEHDNTKRSSIIQALAKMTREIDLMIIRDCVDILQPEVSHSDDDDADSQTLMRKEHSAWVQLGATPTHNCVCL